jgi:hypothetical protein
MPERRVTAAQRRDILARAGGRCEYCHSQARFATQPFTVEHIVPRTAAGKTEMDNLALSCFGCNSHKSTKTHAPDPETGQFEPLFHPRKQVWNEHFAWSDDFCYIVGQTPTGRATVEALHMNRPELVNLRQFLHSMGEQPPREE